MAAASAAPGACCGVATRLCAAAREEGGVGAPSSAELLASPRALRLLCATPAQLAGDAHAGQSVRSAAPGEALPLATVVLLDVSGSQMQSARVLERLMCALAAADGAAERGVVIAFGARREELLYDGSRDWDSGGHLSVRPPQALGEFAERLSRSLARWASLPEGSTTRWAARPFRCKTRADAIELGLALLDARGFFAGGREATLLLVGDGEFDEGVAEFGACLARVKPLLRRFVRLAVAPSPHVSGVTLAAMRGYALDVCASIEGLVCSVLAPGAFTGAGADAGAGAGAGAGADGDAWVRAVVDASGLLRDEVSVLRPDAPFRCIYSSTPVVVHRSVAELPIHVVAEALRSNPAGAVAAARTLRSVLADPLQLSRLCSDRTLAALYSALARLVNDEDEELVRESRAVMAVVAGMLNHAQAAGARHQQLLRRLVNEAKGDPVVRERRAQLLAASRAQGAAFCIVARGDPLSARQLADIASPRPCSASMRSALRWLGSLEVLRQVDADESGAAFLPVPGKSGSSNGAHDADADAPDTSWAVHIVRLLPSLCSALSGWSDRAALQVALFALANLRIGSGGIEPRVARLLWDAVQARDWAELLELREANTANFAGLMIDLVSQAAAAGLELPGADQYRALARVMRLRRALDQAGAAVSVAVPVMRAAPGALGRVEPRESTGSAAHRFVCQFYGYSPGTTTRLSRDDVLPFVLGVPVEAACADVAEVASAAPPFALLFALSCDSDVRLHLHRGRAGKALRTVLRKQIAALCCPGPSEEWAISRAGGAERVPRFATPEEARALVRAFKQSVDHTAHCRTSTSLETFWFPVRQLVAFEAVTSRASLCPRTVAVALDGTGRVRQEQMLRLLQPHAGTPRGDHPDGDGFIFVDHDSGASGAGAGAGAGASDSDWFELDSSCADYSSVDLDEVLSVLDALQHEREEPAKEQEPSGEQEQELGSGPDCEEPPLRLKRGSVTLKVRHDVLREITLSAEQLDSVAAQVRSRLEDRLRQESALAAGEAPQVEAFATCGVCLSDLSPVSRELVRLARCGHAFCKNCVAGLCGTAGWNLRCPSCREAVEPRQLAHAGLLTWADAREVERLHDAGQLAAARLMTCGGCGRTRVATRRAQAVSQSCSSSPDQLAHEHDRPCGECAAKALAREMQARTQARTQARNRELAAERFRVAQAKRDVQARRRIEQENHRVALRAVARLRQDVFQRDTRGHLVKECPSCWALIAKSTGCDTMICICGHAFSWQSQKTLLVLR